MQSIYTKMFSERCVNELGLEKSIHILFEYIRDLFPFEKIFCYKDILRVMTLFHTEEHIYTNEHIRVLAELADLLKSLINSYYTSKPDPYILLSSEGALSSSPENLLRHCKGLDKVMNLVDLVAPTQSTVLIQGETGSGKELVAETIHALSKQYKGSLVKVNCGAIPETLLDSEFFGAEKGAYTGATATKLGYFEQAHNGTIYLDEIGELSLAAQVRLLRVLEHKEINRVGGTKRIPVNTRVIAATHRNLWDMVKKGTFREDLCYRLNVFPLYIPSLDERQEDIPILVGYFYKLYAHEFYTDNAPILTKQGVEKLCKLHWQGNVRQLRYFIERAMILSLGSKSKELRFDELTANEQYIGENSFVSFNSNKKKKSEHEMIIEITKALTQSQHRIQGKEGAAELLGLSPSTLRSRMKKFNISRTIH